MAPRFRQAAGRKFVAILAAVFACALAAPAAGASAAGLPPDWQRGMNVASWWHDDWEKAPSDASLAALRATGTTSVELVPTWWMNTSTDSSVQPNATKTASDAGLLRAMATARALGMNVVVKPHVDVFDGSFRGDIAPADRDAWYTDYRTMIDHYADLAARGGATMLVVGTELTSMSSDTAEWRRIVDVARARFSGRLTFAANQLDGALRIGFWDALDFIGVDAYMPLAAAGADPSVDDLTAAWWQRGYVSDLGKLSARTGKPVIFTELGYQSRTGTAQTPWWTNGAVSADAQQRAYEAAFRAWSGVPWFRGIYWWDWSAAGGYDPSDGEFSVRGKPAEDTLRAWNTGPYTAPPAPAPAPPARPAPEGTAVPAGVKRRVRVHVRARRAARAKVWGAIRPGCAGQVAVALRHRKRGGRWAHTRRLHIRARANGRFSRTVRLRRGTYRAVARVRSGCGGAAASPSVKFRAR